MSTTQNYGLRLTPASETTTTFLDWRLSINGDGNDSNMELIDAAIYEAAEGAVRHDNDQSLTDGEKMRARSNIGAAALSISGTTLVVS